MSILARRLERQCRDALEDALAEAGEWLRERAARDIPKGDPATDPDPAFALREHGRVEMSPDGRYVTVRFDGPYAAKVHEAQHFQHPRGGKSKYLEDALKAELPRLEGIVAGKVRARVRRGR